MCSFCFSTNSTQTEIALELVNILASIQASKCTAIAPAPEVAAAYILAVSSSIWLEKMLFLPEDFGSTPATEEMSETLFPYALNSTGVEGSDPSNKAPRRLAVLCDAPSSASDFLFWEIVDAKRSYS